MRAVSYLCRFALEGVAPCCGKRFSSGAALTDSDACGLTGSALIEKSRGDDCASAAEQIAAVCKELS